MTRCFRYFIPSLLSLLIIGFGSDTTYATSVVMLSDRDLIVSSRLIVKGVIRTVTPAWDDARQMVWTYVEVECEEVLKGEVRSRTIVLKQLGGDTGEGGVQVLGQPTFLENQRVLLYLNTAPDGTLHVAHAFIGRFLIKTTQSGDTVVTREIPRGEVQLLTQAAQGEKGPITDHAGLGDYEQKIREVLDHDDAVDLYEERYRSKPLVEMPEEYARKRLASGSIIPNFTLTAGGLRWMEADAGQAVGFFLNPARCPVTGGGTAEVTRALTAWSNQSGASISLQIAGQTANCGQQSDGVNVISFGDCLNQLDAPVGCSGVVAQTQVRYTLETRVVSGITFRRLFEADIVFNDGMDCFLGNSANLAEVACHEVGHAIGLGHSDNPNALMWAVSRGSRDATLGDDDKAAVLTVYPASGGGGGGGGGTPPPTDDAVFSAQSVPSAMNPGQAYTVSITMRNTGTSNWGNGVQLGSQNPSDTSLWGVSRVSLTGQVPPGGQATFTFTITSPNGAGTYNFQWRLWKDGAGYFGASTPNLAITVGGSGGGGGGGGTLLITSLSFADAVVNRAYKQALSATGGTPPYRWQLASGSLPPGLRLVTGGSIEGTPTRSGIYNFALQVFDNSGSTFNLDSRRFTMTVTETGSSSSLPVVTRVKIKGVKKFFVFGHNFEAESLILLNGFLLTPNLYEQDGETGLLVYKGRLTYQPAGQNVVQVFTRGNPSGRFLF